MANYGHQGLDSGFDRADEYAGICDLPYELVERIVQETQRGPVSLQYHTPSPIDPIVALSATCRHLHQMTESWLRFSLTLDFADLSSVWWTVRHLVGSERLQRRLRTVKVIVPPCVSDDCRRMVSEGMYLVAHKAPFVARFFVDLDCPMSLHAFWQPFAYSQNLRHFGCFARGHYVLHQTCEVDQILTAHPGLETISLDSVWKMTEEEEAEVTKSRSLRALEQYRRISDGVPLACALTRLCLYDCRLWDGELLALARTVGGSLTNFIVGRHEAIQYEYLSLRGIRNAVAEMPKLVYLEISCRDPQPGNLFESPFAPLPTLTHLAVSSRLVGVRTLIGFLDPFPNLHTFEFVRHPTVHLHGLIDDEDRLRIGVLLDQFDRHGGLADAPSSIKRICGVPPTPLALAFSSYYLTEAGITLFGERMEQRLEQDPTWRFKNSYRATKRFFLPLLTPHTAVDDEEVDDLSWH